MFLLLQPPSWSSAAALRSCLGVNIHMTLVVVVVRLFGLMSKGFALPIKEKRCFPTQSSIFCTDESGEVCVHPGLEELNIMYWTINKTFTCETF